MFEEKHVQLHKPVFEKLDLNIRVNPGLTKSDFEQPAPDLQRSSTTRLSNCLALSAFINQSINQLINHKDNSFIKFTPYYYTFSWSFSVASKRISETACRFQKCSSGFQKIQVYFRH